MTTTTHCCPSMAAAIDDSAVPVIFIPKFREYGLQILDGGTSFQVLNFCPWCGARLPPSLRDRWFDEMERMGLDPSNPDAIPDEYKDHHWYPDS